MIWALAGGLIIVIFILVRITSRKPEPDNLDDRVVPLGNVSIFMDRKGSMEVIPFSLDKLKRGRASEYPLILASPYSVGEVGKTIREGLRLSSSGKSLTSEELMRSLGFFDWKDYSKEKKSVSVTSINGEVVFNSTIRHRDGSFIFRVQGYEKVLPGKLSDQALGNMVLDLMKFSR